MNKDIIGVECLGGTRLRLIFEGDERREVDVSQLVPFDGVFEPLNDPSFFRQVAVNPDVGTVVWPNGADLCPDVLYDRGRTVGTTNPRELRKDTIDSIEP